MPPKQRKGPARHSQPSPETTTNATKSSFSQQVNWLTVHRFVAAVLNQVNDWPTLGTPAWCSLTHEDPRRWAALLDGAQHWALRMDSCQEARCEASRTISGAVDWPAVSQEIAWREARPWASRVVE